MRYGWFQGSKKTPQLADGDQHQYLCFKISNKPRKVTFFPFLTSINNNKLLLYNSLTNLSRASFLWDIGKENSARWDATKRGVPSGAILFAYTNFIEK